MKFNLSTYFYDDNFWKLGLIGLLTGILASFIGGGAEILIVPMLVWFKIFSHYKIAIGTSLASLLLPIGIFAVIAYMRHTCNKTSCVNWPYALILSFFFTIGTLMSFYSVKIDTFILKKIYAVVLVIFGVVIFFQDQPTKFLK